MQDSGNFAVTDHIYGVAYPAPQEHFPLLPSLNPLSFSLLATWHEKARNGVISTTLTTG
ncbi:hypothetical protein SEHO0A_03135 [Salmonella enterica subsp. houtenae str. ATCC BAA-1581]|nr:hypothetical protein SEHO0A_03135 [Salmonella enterica subsp. houtenae str. ATCC BAA-1581]